MARMPQKLSGLIKKYGIPKGSGEYVAKQTNIKAMKTVVPVAMGVMLLGALAPSVANTVSSSVATVPVIGPLTVATANAGASLKSRLGFNGM
tara:strand:- start:84 stop:359 length:276 start_codon:yes stop_codon:yes gene_type:complete